MEPHAHRASELDSYYSPQPENIRNKPSWDSLHLTMKQNTRPSCPDWTSPLLYPHVQKEYEAKDARMARYLAKNISEQALYPEILSGRTKSGCKLPGIQRPSMC
ncbi:hypothetical protein AAG906_033386 [Vitis piasezkii]